MKLLKKYVIEIILHSVILEDKPNGNPTDKAEINASFYGEGKDFLLYICWSQA
jgi:hypothetical protein